MGRVRTYGGCARGAIYFGGANPTDGDYITIGDKTFEFDSNAAVTAGRVSVTIGGNAAATLAALLAAILANVPSPGITAAADFVATTLGLRLRAINPGENGNVALAASMTDVLNIVSGAAMTGGENAGDATIARGEYVVTALDVLMASVVIPTGLVSPRFVQMERYRSGELLEAVTGVKTISGGDIRHDFAGATDLAAADVLSWAAWE